MLSFLLDFLNLDGYTCLFDKYKDRHRTKKHNEYLRRKNTLEKQILEKKRAEWDMLYELHNYKNVEIIYNKITHHYTIGPRLFKTWSEAQDFVDRQNWIRTNY